MDYSKTVNLPKTDFPMKAELAKREPEILKHWEREQIYKKILKSRKDAPLYILHDGPPYANGNIHMGHALNKILKDVIVKHKSMMGFKSPYVPGWDCHGLPIELQVTRELGDEANRMPKIQIRKRCREYADKYIHVQMDEFKRLGVFGDYDNPYLTMSADYEAKIVEIFGNIFEKGFIYKSKKPIYWCPTCITALAEAEVEYGDHRSPSIYVKFKVAPESVRIAGVDPDKVYVVIWTTTPWTLPANLAVSFHPSFPYSAYKSGDDYYIVADGLADQISHITGLSFEKSVPVTREQLEKLIVFHPFIERESKVIFADFVTLDQGTGVVHIAPGHGLEDYLIGLEYGIDTYSPVDDEGRFTDEFEPMQGVTVFESNQKLVDLMGANNTLLHVSEIVHSYPHCWRCKNPLIFRATEQWFFKIDHNDMRKKALQATDDTQWIPSWGRVRFRGMVETRPDWCLSRQRSWGVPIPSIRCRKCGKNVMTAETILNFARISLEKSIDSWYTEEIADLFPHLPPCECGSDEFEKEYDILDVWFDSGVSHFAVLDKWDEHRWPSDLYLEGSDQHRGWFQSSLWPALALRDRAPYHSVLTHGFVLDENGKAMSKSAGNVIHPEEIINKYGSDVLRLWVASEDYRNDVRIGYEMMKQVADSYRRIRNTLRFIIGNLADFSSEHALSYEKLSAIDKWILHRLYQLSVAVIECYERFEFHLVYRKILNFCAVELSSIYFDISKDILYIEKRDSMKRRANQTVLSEILNTLVRLIAPILAFTAEEVWKFYFHEGTVHAEQYYVIDEKFNNPEIENKMLLLVEIKQDVLKALEQKRKEKYIGNSLEAEVQIYVKSESTRKLLAEMDERNRFFQVSQLEILDTISDELEEYDHSYLSVKKSEGVKCERCWNYFNSADIGTEPEYPGICKRCSAIVKQIQQI
jgi:isoleucyl-tRNA synthetase